MIASVVQKSDPFGNGWVRKELRSAVYVMKDVIYKYTFIIQDADYARQVFDELIALKRKYPNFYVKESETRRHSMFAITTDDPNNDDFKKILFRIGLKVVGGIKTRVR